MLRDVKLGLLDDAGETIDCHHAMINRYGVDRVSADLMLGFFFPGAAMADTRPPTVDTGTGTAGPATEPADAETEPLDP